VVDAGRPADGREQVVAPGLRLGELQRRDDIAVDHVPARDEEPRAVAGRDRCRGAIDDAL